MGHGRRPDRGGIASLAGIIEEHGGAIEYDLLTKTRYSLEDVGGALSWGAFRSFIQHLPEDSAYRRETVEGLEWYDGRMVAPVLADIWDALETLAYMYATRNTKKGKHVPRPKPYPRPWVEDRSRRRIGKGAIPVSEFESWWSHGGR